MSDQFRQISQKFAELLASVETKPEPIRHGLIFDTKVVAGRPVEVKYKRHVVAPRLEDQGPSAETQSAATVSESPATPESSSDVAKGKRVFLVRRPLKATHPENLGRPDRSDPENGDHGLPDAIAADVAVPHGLRRNQSQLRAPSEAKVLMGTVERPRQVATERSTMGEKSSIQDIEGLKVGSTPVSTLQKLGIFLLSGAYVDAGDAERMDRVDVWMQSVGEANAHAMFDVLYWTAGWKDGGRHVLQLTHGLRMVSLVGLVVLANRRDLLNALARSGVDVRRQAARVVRNSSTRAVSAIGLALQFRTTAFFEWLDARGRSLGLVGEPVVNEELSETLRSSIRRWSSDARAVSNDQLVMVCVLLKLGATIDQDSMSLLGSRLEVAPTSDPRMVWSRMAKVVARCDTFGVAALQTLISAASFDFDVLPVDGMDSPLTPYVIGEQVQAVEVLLASGVDPRVADASGLTPRDHGDAAGSRHSVALIDLHVAKLHLDELERSAREMEIVDRLLEGVDITQFKDRSDDDVSVRSQPVLHGMDFVAVRQLIREASRSGFIAA